MLTNLNSSKTLKEKQLKQQISLNKKWLFWSSILLFSIVTIYGFGRSGVEAISYALVLHLTLYVIRRLSNRLFCGYMILTFCLSFLYLPHALNYGQLSVGSLASVLETNANEAFEYLINTPVFSYIAGISYFLLFLAVLKLNKNQPTKLPEFHKKSHKYLFYFLCFLVVVSVVQKPLYYYNKYDAQKRQQMGWKIPSTTKNYPIKFIFDFLWLQQDYYVQKTKLDYAKQQAPTWQVINSSQKYKNYVIIIGESMRKDYMSVYGYPIVTTPFLQSKPAVIFDNFISPASHTATSLQRMLFQQQDYKNINYANTVVSLANMAGMDTYWLSNQGTMGKYDTMASSIAIKADEKYFTKVGSYDSSNVSDLALLNKLQKIVNSVDNTNSNKSRLIVLHIIGSHPKFCNRLDKDYQVDNVEGFLNSDMSCYLSTIRQTDKLMDSVYQTLQQKSQQVPSLKPALQNKKSSNEGIAKVSEQRFSDKTEEIESSGFSMMYFSDHGLSHRNRNNQSYKPTTLLHGDDTKQNYQVPLIILSSDDREVVRVTGKKSGFDLMVGLAQWLGIEEKTLSQKNDFFDSSSNNNVQKIEGHDNDVDKTTSINASPIKVFANGSIINYDDLADDPAILP